MKHPTQAADQRRTHDLGFSDEGPGDVATLRRLLAESEARNEELRRALNDLARIIIQARSDINDRLAAFDSTIVEALKVIEE